jgi:hypothetical protein
VPGACGLKAAAVHEEVSMSGHLDLSEHTNVCVYHVHEVCVIGIQLPGVVQRSEQG